MRRHYLCAVAVGVAVSASTVAAAQTWVNPKGELTLQLHEDYQISDGVYHGSTLVTDLGADAFNSSFAVEYVPIDKLALELTQYANMTRYTGLQMIPGYPYPLAHGANDDGKYHFSVTDLELESRYQAYDGPITFTPLVHVRVPVTNYEQKGYGAAGAHLAEAGVGFHIGKYGLGLEDLVLQFGYQFTYVELERGDKTAAVEAALTKYRTNRSDFDLSLSYVINSKFIVGAGAVFRYTHDGFDLADYVNLNAGDPLIMWHDPVLKQIYVAPVVVASYQFSQSWSLLFRAAKVLWGASVSDPYSFGLTLFWAQNLLD